MQRKPNRTFLSLALSLEDLDYLVNVVGADIPRRKASGEQLLLRTAHRVFDKLKRIQGGRPQGGAR